MDRAKALDKIKKCLRLGASSNPNEAAAAMRQARALMQKHGIEEGDVLTSDVLESRTRAGSKIKPAQWEVMLAQVVSRAYCCSVIFISLGGEWKFIGEMAEIASYTMAVLLRQARNARNKFISERLSRCKPANKTKRADVFCEAWVYAVHRQVTEFAGNGEPSNAVKLYMEKHYSDLSQCKPIDRNKSSARKSSDIEHGLDAARGVSLNHGVGGTGAPLALA